MPFDRVSAISGKCDYEILLGCAFHLNFTRSMQFETQGRNAVWTSSSRLV
uniref:Uncharacterized protein n=1 Tax=Anguilla anguilla TaxID=7936 RepID=A0A0E9QMN8_ANGAN